MGHSKSQHQRHTCHGAQWCPGCGVGPFKITTPKTHEPWSPMVTWVVGFSFKITTTKTHETWSPMVPRVWGCAIQNHHTKGTRAMESHGVQGVGLCHSKSQLPTGDGFFKAAGGPTSNFELRNLNFELRNFKVQSSKFEVATLDSRAPHPKLEVQSSKFEVQSRLPRSLEKSISG